MTRLSRSVSNPKFPSCLHRLRISLFFSSTAAGSSPSCHSPFHRSSSPIYFQNITPRQQNSVDVIVSINRRGAPQKCSLRARRPTLTSIPLAAHSELTTRSKSPIFCLVPPTMLIADHLLSPAFIRAFFRRPYHTAIGISAAFHFRAFWSSKL